MLFSVRNFSQFTLNIVYGKKKIYNNFDKNLPISFLNNLTINRKNLIGKLIFTFSFFKDIKKAYPDQSSLSIIKKGFTTKYGLKIYFYSKGLGNKPKWGDYVRINYVIYLLSENDLIKIDSTYERNKTFLFKHGSGQIISGIEEAIHNVNQGSKIRIIIPNNLSYSKLGIGPIPPSLFKRNQLLEEINKPFESIYSLLMDIEIVSVIENNI